MPTILLFAIGFVTWFVVLLRAYVLDGRQTAYLCCLIFTDEAIGIGTGIWLARNGGWQEVIAVAAGGTLAAWVAMKLFKRRDER